MRQVLIILIAAAMGMGVMWNRIHVMCHHAQDKEDGGKERDGFQSKGIASSEGGEISYTEGHDIIRDDDFCHTKEYRAYTLKLIKEAAFSGLFQDVRNQTKFEGSDVAVVNESYYVVFDSSMSLGYFDSYFHFRGESNKLIGDRLKESQYEGIAYVPENDTFLLLHESLPTRRGDGGDTATTGKDNDGQMFKPYTSTGKIHTDMSGYDVVETCRVEFELTHENKGFEAIAYAGVKDGVSYMLGLCEGNYCVGGKKGKKPGHGKIVMTKKSVDDKGDCVWEPVKVIDIPKSADFVDYSGMAINYERKKIAILSQENAAVFIADFDPDTNEFLSEDGEIFHLPRDNHCNMIYCNAEGIQWLDDYRILIASDKAKSNQPYWCDAKDQSIHIFSFPPAWDPFTPE